MKNVRQIKFKGFWMSFEAKDCFQRQKYLKLYGPFLWMGFNCLKATQPLWGDSLLFTTKVSKNPWYLLDQSRKDERMRWPWSHPVVLNSCIKLVITKYKLKLQYVKLTQLWPLTVNCAKVSSQYYRVELSWNCQKSVSSAHIYNRD